MTKNLFLKVSLQEKILFTKNLALSIKAGVSLVNSLQFIRMQMKSRSFRKILDEVLTEVNRGKFLSDSLAKYSNVFGELFVNIIRIGETSGNLPGNLLFLGDELKKQSELRKKVKGAMIYPIIIMIVTVIIATSMIVFVFPKILPLFQNIKGGLPLTTRILIKLSDVISNFGIYLGLGVVAFFIGFRLLLRIPAVRFVFHEILFYVPIAGRSIVYFNMANFTRTLGILLRSGIPIVDSITIAARSLTNLVYQRYLKLAGDQIRKGDFLSKYLARYPKRFPVTMVNLITVGENTGNLTDNLAYVAEYYENEVDDLVKNLSNILEPILLVFMGTVVGFIALSFITPIYQLTRSLH